MNNPVAPQVIQRIRAEYLEMPGLTLKPEQVQRLCGVDGALCQTVLEALVESGFLLQRPDGAYARDRDRDISRAKPAKAILDSGAHARNRARAS